MKSEQDFPLPPELDNLSAFIESHIESLAEPSAELRSIALCAAKHVFDWAVKTEVSSKPCLETLLSTLTETTPPQTRSQAGNPSKQKHSPSPIHKSSKKIVVQETPLPSLFIDDMNSEQIWQQLDLRAARVCENLQVLQGEDEDAELEGEDSDNDETEEEVEEEAEDMDIDDEDHWEEESGENDDDGSTAEEEGIVDLREEISEDEEPPTSMLDIVSGKRRMKPHSQRQSELDDGFFDLAAFNAETSQAEAKQVSGREQELTSDEDSGEESELDLFGPVDDLEVDEDGLDGGDGELFYKDFFDAPRISQNGNRTKLRSSKVRFHEQVAVKKIKAVGKGKPVSSMGEEDSDDEDDDDS